MCEIEEEGDDTPEVQSVRVVRTCPRCRTRTYQQGNDLGVKNRIQCVNCGYTWIGRISKDEQR